MTNKMSFWAKFNSKILVILGIGLIIVFSVAASKEFIRKHQLDNEIAELESEIDKLKVEEDEFIKLIDNYNSENYIEQEARVNFNYKKKGEKVVVIKTDENKIYLDSNDNTSKESNSNQVKTDAKASNLRIWWDYFFGEKTL